MKKWIACLLAALLMAAGCACADSAGVADAVSSIPEGSFDRPFALGVSYVFTAEINEDGTARTVASGDAYHAIELSVMLTDVLGPEQYEGKYSRTYALTGTEACCVLQVTLNSSAGGEVVLQDAILVGLCDVDGNIAYGYQMMDEEIGGNPGVSIGAGETKSFYKRYDYREEPELTYLFITYYVNGQSETVYFSLRAPYPALSNGGANDQAAVVKLQNALITRGFLTGDADGIFGRMTEDAVRRAQAEAGLEQTGVADDALQRWLYGE